MIPVVHVLGPQLDEQTRRCASSLIDSPPRGITASVVQIAGPSLRAALVAAKRLGREARGALVHAWGPAALPVAALASNVPVLYTPQPSLAAREIRWLRAILQYRTVHVLCETEYQRHLLRQAGLDPARCHLLRPGADFARLRRYRNPAIRAALGLTQHDHVILAIGESTPAARHRAVIWAVAILHVLDPRYKVLLWGRGPAWPRLQRFSHQLGNPNMLRIAQEILAREVQYEELLAAADVAVYAGTEQAGIWPIVTTMAAGVPIIAVASHCACELLENRQTATLTPDVSAQRLAERILELTEDASLGRSICQQARAKAYEQFPLSRYLEQHACLYEQLAGGKTAARCSV